MPFLCEVISHIAINHFCNGSLVLSNIVQVLTLKYFPVFLHLYLLLAHLYTFDEVSKGLTTYQFRLNVSKCLIHFSSFEKVLIS